MRVYLAPKVLIIDEMGYGDWGSIFGNPIIATAIPDRLLHHSTTINIRGRVIG